MPGERRAMLERAVAHLARAPHDQLACLAEEGCRPPEDYIDELALSFDDMAAATEDMVTSGELSTSQAETVTSLSRYLSTISGDDNAHLWTETALRSSSEWGKVRELAAVCLGKLRSP
jgi:hypothetical protein